MRYAFDLRMLRSSGIGRYLSSTVPRIIARSKSVSYDLLCDTSEVSPTEYPWVSAEHVALIDSRAPIYSIAEQREILSRVGREVDLFWSPHYNIPVAYRGKLMVTIHDVMHLALPEHVQGLHRRAYAWAMFRLAVTKAAGIVCVSRFTADELMRFTGVSSRKVRVIHNGVDSSWFHARPEGSPVGKPYLLFVGNVKPHKNLRRLVDAFASLAAEIPHDLLIVGQKEGFITGDARIEAEAARLSGRVRFTGAVNDAALRQFFLHADLLVFPSLYEGFGLPPLEAMACGCPVVASNAASIPEVCGEAALYFDPTDAADMARQIRRMLTDRPLREELVVRGRERARAFTWERSAEETGAALDAAASGSA